MRIVTDVVDLNWLPPVVRGHEAEFKVRYCLKSKDTPAIAGFQWWGKLRLARIFLAAGLAKPQKYWCKIQLRTRPDEWYWYPGRSPSF